MFKIIAVKVIKLRNKISHCHYLYKKNSEFFLKKRKLHYEILKLFHKIKKVLIEFQMSVKQVSECQKCR